MINRSLFIQRSSARSSLILAACATALYLLAKGGQRVSLLADDFFFAANHAAGNLSLFSFSAIIAKRPVTGFFEYWLFQSGLPECSQMQFVLAFFIQSLGFIILAKDFVGKDRLTMVFTSVVLGIFCFSPSYFEILLMNLNLPYSLGTLFMAIGLTRSRTGARAFWYTLAFGSFETFIIPILLYPLIKLLFTQKEWKNETSILLRHMAAFITASLCFVLIRLCLSHVFPSLTYHTQITAQNFGERFRDTLEFVFTISFYKINWVSTALLEIAVLTAAIECVRRKILSLRSFAIIGFLIIASSLPVWLINYYAPRAFQGTIILGHVVFAGLLIAGLQNARFTIKALTLSSCAIAFAIQLAIIFRVKESNFALLGEQSEKITRYLHDCKVPCVISDDIVTADFKRDWIMPEFAKHLFIATIYFETGTSIPLTIEIREKYPKLELNPRSSGIRPMFPTGPELGYKYQ